MLSNFLFPIVCIFCGTRSERELALCQACESDLPWLGDACQQCALPLATNKSNHLRCPDCLSKPPPFEHVYALFHYQHPISHFITQLKFHKQLLYAKIFGLLLAERLMNIYKNQTSQPQLLIPMPLHKKRLRARGFNQSLEISRAIKKKLGLAIDTQVCQRIKATQAQSLLVDQQQRAANVKNAFQATPLKEKHILIIDDVMTTGHTLKELSRELRKNGAVRIDVACCARTS